jgi:hypothetical protein
MATAPTATSIVATAAVCGVHGLFCWIIQIAEVTKFAHDVHERIVKLKETSPAVETLVNFVRDLME